MSKPRIAFFGLGTMGIGMARRLLGAGYPLTVWNRTAGKAEALAGEGARLAKSPREAAQGAQVLISMVADDASSRTVWSGESGALAAAPRDAVAIECSTISVPWARDLAKEAASRGIKFLDAPVTGTKPHAANGELTFIVGGDADTLEDVRPILQVMSKEILHLGPTGSGAMLKLINNFACGVQGALLGEVTALIARAGLNQEKALHLLLTGAPGSPLFKAFTTRINSSDPTVYFQLRHMAKDITYAIGEGKALNLEMPTAVAALEAFKKASDAGFGSQDVSAILKYVQQT